MSEITKQGEIVMIENTVFKNGATWLRTDFHLHTKADSEFIYNEDANYFAKKYIDKLTQEKIHIGLITNHNKFDVQEFKELRTNASKENIYLIPGIEFSIKDGAKGIHLLIAFHDNWIYNKENKNHIQTFIDSAFIGVSNFSNVPYFNSSFNLTEVYTKLNEFNMDYFFILAHVDDSSGLFQEVKGRNLQNLLTSDAFKEKVLALQKSRNFDNRNTLINNKIAFVEGTDCSESGIAGLGKGNQVHEITQKTYIKIGDFNFEALKFALLDAENRVKTEIPKINNSYIKSIKFEGGKLDGVIIDFSPELNNLIGIRGSGKSSIIEILRYVLGITLSQSASDEKYKNDLIQFILGSGGKVIVELVDNHQKLFRVEKIYGQKEDIFNENMLQQGISIDAIFKTPIYFGQKDLSNKNVNFESDLMNRLIGNKLKPIQDKITLKENEIKNIIFEKNKIADLEEKKKETELAINNAKQQIKIFQEKGIEEKLKTQTQFDKDSSHILSLKEKIKDFKTEISNIIENYQYFTNNSVEKSEINKEIFEEVEQLKILLNAEFQKLLQIQTDSNEILEKFNNIIEKLNTKRESLKEEFAKIKQELNSDTINPDTYLVLNRNIDLSNMKLNEIARLETKRIDLQKQLGKKLVELNSLWLEEFRIIESEITKINSANSKLQIEVIYKGRKDKFLEKIKETFRGTGIRETSYEQISKEFADFIEIYKDQTKLKKIINETQFVDFYNRFDEQLQTLLTYKVDNQTTIKYNGKLLKDHSLGQRASALILFILAQQENDVLIIDQPEDDLDNQTIYDEVIKEIKKLKGNMQFIFATHNANIPVLGDSEKIVSCSFDEKKINVQQGSIDTSEIQKSIVDIMEGGDEAFSKRKSIYGIWNVKNKGQKNG